MKSYLRFSKNISGWALLPRQIRHGEETEGEEIWQGAKFVSGIVIYKKAVEVFVMFVAVKMEKLCQLTMAE